MKKVISQYFALVGLSAYSIAGASITISFSAASFSVYFESSNTGQSASFFCEATNFSAKE